MPNFELTAEGALSLIKQLSDEEFDKLSDLLLADEDESEANEGERESEKSIDFSLDLPLPDIEIELPSMLTVSDILKEIEADENTLIL